MGGEICLGIADVGSGEAELNVGPSRRGLLEGLRDQVVPGQCGLNKDGLLGRADGTKPVRLALRIKPRAVGQKCVGNGGARPIEARIELLKYLTKCPICCHYKPFVLTCHLTAFAAQLKGSV